MRYIISIRIIVIKFKSNHVLHFSFDVAKKKKKKKRAKAVLS